MKIVFLSGLFPANLLKEIEANSKGGIQYAANTLQWNFVLGLNANNDEPVHLITAPLIGSFPFFYKKILIKKKEFTLNKKTDNISVGYCNLAVIKNYFIKKSLLKELKCWVKKNPEEEKIIVIYGMHAPWVLAGVKIKEKYPDVKICLIVPDLPEFMSNSKSVIFKLRTYFLPNLYPYLSMFDAFVFLTDKMAKHFNVKDKPWITIEGMVNPDEINAHLSSKKAEKKIILYSGTLAERYGILDLLAAFGKIIDRDYELWICGSGNTGGAIKAKAIVDNRIKFLGLLPREAVLELQRKATVLVNPRNSDGEYTKYSFPSKIMEYLLSGTPCIMKPLPGIPNEYNKYIFFVQGNDINSFKNRIQEVCCLDISELKRIGESAQKFVLEKKNYKVQTKKMTDLFKTLFDNKKNNYNS